MSVRLVCAQPPETGSTVTALSGTTGPALSPPSSGQDLFSFLQNRFAGAVGPPISSSGYLAPGPGTGLTNPLAGGGGGGTQHFSTSVNGDTHPLMFGVSARSADDTAASTCAGVMYEFGVLTSGQPMIKLCGNDAIVFNGTVNWGAWNHVAWTYDGESGFLVYLNGTALSFLSGPSTASTLPTSVGVPAQIVLNDNRERSTAGLSGVLSYVSTLRFYNTTLTEEQVLRDMNGFRQNGIVAEYLSKLTRNNENILLKDAIYSDSTTQTYFNCNEANGCSVLTL